MIRALARRALSFALSLVAASVVIFVLLQAVPGDPASFMLGTGARPDTVAALRAELGLDGSLAQRYAAWVGGMLTGDLGTSYTYRVPVSGLVADRIGVSAPLAAIALVLTVAIALPVGLIAATGRGGPSDWGLMGAAQLSIAVPNFWFAMLLVLVFAVWLGWFGAGGFPGWFRPGRGAQGADPPRGRAGASAGIDLGPRPAVEPSGHAGPGLRPDGTCQGAQPAGGRLAALPAQRDDPSTHDPGAPVLLPAGRSHHH